MLDLDLLNSFSSFVFFNENICWNRLWTPLLNTGLHDTHKNYSSKKKSTVSVCFFSLAASVTNTRLTLLNFSHMQAKLKITHGAPNDITLLAYTRHLALYIAPGWWKKNKHYIKIESCRDERRFVSPFFARCIAKFIHCFMQEWQNRDSKLNNEVYRIAWTYLRGNNSFSNIEWKREPIVGFNEHCLCNEMNERRMLIISSMKCKIDALVYSTIFLCGKKIGFSVSIMNAYNINKWNKSTHTQDTSSIPICCSIEQLSENHWFEW